MALCAYLATYAPCGWPIYIFHQRLSSFYTGDRAGGWKNQSATAGRWQRRTLIEHHTNNNSSSSSRSNSRSSRNGGGIVSHFYPKQPKTGKAADLFTVFMRGDADVVDNIKERLGSWELLLKWPVYVITIKTSSQFGKPHFFVYCNLGWNTNLRLTWNIISNYSFSKLEENLRDAQSLKWGRSRTFICSIIRC